jgi:hypothetical protein
MAEGLRISRDSAMLHGPIAVGDGLMVSRRVAAYAHLAPARRAKRPRRSAALEHSSRFSIAIKLTPSMRIARSPLRMSAGRLEPPPLSQNLSP